MYTLTMFKKLESLFRRLIPKRLSTHRVYTNALNGKQGLEIGGPSPLFGEQGFLPVYSVIKGLDACNFSSDTMWEGRIKEGNTFQFGNKTGHQFIADGSCLDFIRDRKYDFILSSHSLEHMANPIKALQEWKRVLKDNGYILLVLPHKDQTFDHQRPVTTMSHLLEDLKNETGEDDQTHFEEILDLHDLNRDSHVPDRTYLKNRTVKNFEIRGVHHHVFNTPLVVQIADFMQLQILDINHFNPFNITALLQKSGSYDNSSYFEKSNPVFSKEKFPSDKTW